MMELHGFDELEKTLDNMIKGAEELDGENHISFDELFPQKFMLEHSTFSTFFDFLEAGGFKVDSQEDFDAIPDEEFDTYISNSTQFDSWDEMIGVATEVYAYRKLGLE